MIKMWLLVSKVVNEYEATFSTGEDPPKVLEGEKEIFIISESGEDKDSIKLRLITKGIRKAREHNILFVNNLDQKKGG